MNRPFEDLYLLAVLRSPLIGLTMNDFLALQAHANEEGSLSQFVYSCRGEQGEHLSEATAQACLLIQQWLDRWAPLPANTSLAAALSKLVDEIGLPLPLLAQENGIQKMKNIEKLIDIIAAEPLTSLEEVLDFLNERIAVSAKEGEAESERLEGDAVQIMTVHASKGLEFPIVCLPHIDRAVRSDPAAYAFVLNLGLYSHWKRSQTLSKKLRL